MTVAVFRSKVNAASVECLVCPRVAGQHARIENRHIERHMQTRCHRRAIIRSKSSRFTDRTTTAIDIDDMTDDICFPDDSMMVEDFRDILTPPFRREGDDDDDPVPLHLLWDPTESADWTMGYGFSYDTTSPHELEDDGDGGNDGKGNDNGDSSDDDDNDGDGGSSGDGVNDADEQDPDTIDLSGESTVVLLCGLGSDNSAGLIFKRTARLYNQEFLKSPVYPWPSMPVSGHTLRAASSTSPSPALLDVFDSHLIQFATLAVLRGSEERRSQMGKGTEGSRCTNTQRAQNLPEKG